MSNAILKEPYYDSDRQAVVADVRVNDADADVYMCHISRELLRDKFIAKDTPEELVKAYLKNKPEIDDRLRTLLTGEHKQSILTLANF